MSDVNIKYQGTSIATIDASGSKTLQTSGKYCEGDIVVEYTDPEKPTQAKSATPTETAQDITPDSGKVLSKVSVGAIPKTYVGSGVTKKAAATVSPSTSEQTVCASGVYTTGAQKVSAITPSIVGNLDASSFAASIVAAIEGKGVTVPDGTLLDGIAALIDSIESGGVGGGPADHRGYPVVTGEITFSEDVTSSFLLEFGEGSRLRVKTTSGFLNRPFFIMTNSFSDHDANGDIKIISCPAYAAGPITPTVYAFINAYTVDASSWNSTYMKFTNLSWTTTAESINASAGSDRTFTGVTIPCTANLKFKAGYTYRYVVEAPWGYPIDTVEVI